MELLLGLLAGQPVEIAVCLDRVVPSLHPPEDSGIQSRSESLDVFVGVGDVQRSGLRDQLAQLREGLLVRIDDSQAVGGNPSIFGRQRLRASDRLDLSNHGAKQLALVVDVEGFYPSGRADLARCLGRRWCSLAQLEG